MADDKNLILAVNAGSSSLKVSLFERTSSSADEDSPIALILTSSVDGLSSPPATFSFAFADKAKADQAIKKEEVKDVHDHTGAFAHFLGRLAKEGGIPAERIANVCHRVVHGGDYDRPTVISRDTYHHIERLTDLAPLHNGAALAVIHASLEHLPGTRSIAYFDTTFHRSLPPHVAAYAIDQDIAQKRGLKKYGFHGISYAYILRTVAAHLQQPESATSLIVCHLGSGASMCAIRDGKSVDTSMGLTPLDGLPGGTRAGALDPSLVFHYTNKAGKISHEKSQAVDVGVTEAEEILNKHAGLKALAGTSDFKEITDGMAADPAKRLAFDLFADRVLHFLGAYHVKLGGAPHALVFSGGVGERSAPLRAAVVRAAACLGFALDEAANDAVSSAGEGVVEIGSAPGEGGKRVLVCPTDEQVEMARACALDGEYW